jgi:SNF2 family DNA or RNA helicase
VRKVLKRFRGGVLVFLQHHTGFDGLAEPDLVRQRRRHQDQHALGHAAQQWREELENKFDIPCASTYDSLLCDDPERFWDQPRLIASLAVARRHEHAERLVDRNFDLVIVDEAHHLRDRSSQSYKLVDRLNKRFLLLLSATPVQNDLPELYNLLTLLKPGIFKTSDQNRSDRPICPITPARVD